MYKSGFKIRFPLNTRSNSVQTKNKPMTKKPSVMNVSKRKVFSARQFPIFIISGGSSFVNSVM